MLMLLSCPVYVAIALSAQRIVSSLFASAIILWRTGKRNLRITTGRGDSLLWYRSNHKQEVCVLEKQMAMTHQFVLSSLRSIYWIIVRKKFQLSFAHKRNLVRYVTVLEMANLDSGTRNYVEMHVEPCSELYQLSLCSSAHARVK